MKKTNEEKWRGVTGQGQAYRYVVDQDNVLIADCYADSMDDVGLPAVYEYKKISKRIAMLPDLVRLLKETSPLLRAGSPLRSKIDSTLSSYEALIPR